MLAPLPSDETMSPFFQEKLKSFRKPRLSFYRLRQLGSNTVRQQ